MATTKEAQVLLALPCEQAYQRALTTLQAMPWTITAADPANRVIHATTSVSIASWGEKVSVLVVPDGAGARVEITSAARLKTNMTARGRNQKNVQAVADKLRA